MKHNRVSVLRRTIETKTWIVITGLVLFALGLRLWGMDVRSLSHPEIYVPGIDLPAGISEPPPRHTLYEVLWWHYHDEPHPMGWYLSMFGWTTVFGTSEFALRAPSAILGALSVALICGIGRRAFGPAVGILAAMLLTMHGFHLFWSQNARMYAAGAFLSVLATWLLLRLIDDRSRSLSYETAYVLTVVAGVLTVELFWPLVFLHVGWAALLPPDKGSSPWAPHRSPRLIQLQSLALILSAPALTHAAYRGRGGAAPDPDPTFLSEYLAFGFLFARDQFVIPHLKPPVIIAWVVLGFAVVLLLLAWRARSDRSAVVMPTVSLSIFLRIFAAGASTALMIWLALIAHRRTDKLLYFAVLPALFLVMPSVIAALRTLLLRLTPFLFGITSSRAMLIWMLAIIPPLVLYAASYKVSVLAPRAFLIFIPYLIVLCAAGAIEPFLKGVRSYTISGWILTATTCLIFAASVPYAALKLNSPNDYKALAAAMAEELRPDDLVLMRYRDYMDTPFFYYLKGGEVVVSEYAETLAAMPDRRVWLVTWPWREQPVITDKRRLALKGYKLVLIHERLRAAAELFERAEQP